MTRPLDKLVGAIRDLASAIGRPVHLMEVCGTHTVSIFRNGIRTLLPDNVCLVSGPGCPVCVTAQRHIDAIIELADRPDVIIATYGDMVRVPGRLGSLEQRRARGASVVVVNSAMSVLTLAERNPDRQVVFAAVGFETTAPATAILILEARRRGIRNFSIVCAHKLVVPALEALLSDGNAALDGFLCPGHVSVIIGADAYRPIVERYAVPCVIAGFEPENICSGIASLLGQVLDGEARLENVYSVAVGPVGNPVARLRLEEVFHVADTPWRSLGVIPNSGLELRDCFADFDAMRRFGIVLGPDEDHPACRCGEVIQGRVGPTECQMFGTTCTPLTPFGPCMVSSEGTCSAWFKYHRPRGARSTVALGKFA